MIDKDLFEKGMQIRREVMGDERVDASMGNLRYIHVYIHVGYIICMTYITNTHTHLI